MENLNISEEKEKIKWDCDDEADVLYICFGDPKNAEGVAIGKVRSSGSNLTPEKS